MTEDQLTTPSRSARKRDAKAVEDLARSLVALPEAAIRKMSIDQDLRRETLLARATRGHSSRDRQIRHLAALLRRHPEELTYLSEFLGGFDRRHHQEQEDFHRLEEWRDRLCRPAECARALQEISVCLPDLDTGRLSRLAEAVQAGNDRQSAREIFRLLRAAREKAPGPE